MEGGGINGEPLIIVNNEKDYEEKFLKELSKKRMELISNIVYRVLSNKLGL